MVPIVDKWINVIRYGQLFLLFLLIYVLVLRPIKRQIVTTFQDLPKQLEMAELRVRHCRGLPRARLP